MSDGRRWRRWGIAAALVVAVSWAASWAAIADHERWLSQVAQWLDVGERPRACDYVFVLPGGEETRPFVAAAVVKRGLAKEVLVPRTGDTPGTLDGTWKPAHEVDRAVAVKRGVPAEAVRVIGRGSTSTYTDALALAEFLETRPTATVAVVTNDFHTRRARWIFRNVMGSRSGNLYFVSAPNDHFDATMWWRCRDGAWAHLSEYGKLAMYMFRYGGWPVWGGGALLAAAIAAAMAMLRRLTVKRSSVAARWSADVPRTRQTTLT